MKNTNAEWNESQRYAIKTCSNVGLELQAESRSSHSGQTPQTHLKGNLRTTESVGNPTEWVDNQSKLLVILIKV